MRKNRQKCNFNVYNQRVLKVRTYDCKTNDKGVIIFMLSILFRQREGGAQIDYVICSFRIGKCSSLLHMQMARR